MALDPTQQQPNPLIPPGTQSLPPMLQAALDPPPSPALGFQTWASDARNAHKVQPSMTAADAPLQPNAGQPMASLTPPPTKMQAALTPPGGFNADTGLSTPAPALPVTPQPRVQTQDQANLATDQATLQSLQKSGAGLNKIQNPFLRGLAKAGDIVAPFILGGGAAAIPGTTLHNRYLQQEAQGRVNNDRQGIQLQQQSLQDQANLQHTQLENQYIPLDYQLKQNNAQSGLAQHGLKMVTDDKGNTQIVPDEDSPVYQKQQQQQELMGAQTDAARANVELRNAQAAFKQAQADPNSPLFKQTQQRLQTAQANAAAAAQRAQAYMGRYLQSAYGTGLNGEVLPGASIIGDDNGNQSVVGTGNAAQATKAQSNAAQFNDVHGALDTVESAAKNLVAKGGKLNSPGVAAAMAQPAGTLGQWLQGEGVKANLSPEERAYVQAIAQAHENIQALRKSAGGTATDSAVAKLDALIPGASTPDLNYLLGQTGQIRATAERLGKGATTVAGGLHVRGQGNPLQPPKVGGPGKPNAGAPKDGDTKTNASGDKIVYKGGKWQLQ